MNCVLFAKMDQVFSLKNKTLKNTGKWRKILEKSGNFVSLEKWEPCFELNLKRFDFSIQLIFKFEQYRNAKFVKLREISTVEVLLFSLGH